VGLGGSVRTLLGPGAKPERLELHRSAVALVISSRATVLRTVALLGAGALGVSLRLSLPGGPPLALIVAWRVIREVLDQHPRRRRSRP
ncbi:MAG: hypothetical protein ACRDJF_07910, partial [Actinomycetota bacterium]